MKHTQGNWTVDNNNGTHGVCRIVADQPGTDRVLGIMECCGASPEREANAKLIAAAPELLAALEAAIERLKDTEVTIDGERGACRNWAEIEKDGDYHESINQARAAIAKAKGCE